MCLDVSATRCTTCQGMPYGLSDGRELVPLPREFRKRHSLYAYSNPLSSCDPRQQCASTNAVLTVDIISGPAVSSPGVLLHPGDGVSISDDRKRIVFDIGEGGTFINSGGGYYSWFVRVSMDNCNPTYTWSDMDIQMSWVDDEQNIVDLSDLENPRIGDGQEDIGVCRECGPTQVQP